MAGGGMKTACTLSADGPIPRTRLLFGLFSYSDSVDFFFKMPQIRARNLADLCILFKNYGVGKKFIQHSWGETPDCFWTLTQVKIERIDHRVNRASVYGVLTWKGEERPECRIKDVNKREWAFVPDPERVGPWEIQRVRMIKGQEELTRATATQATADFVRKLAVLRQEGLRAPKPDSSRVQEAQ